MARFGRPPVASTVVGVLAAALLPVPAPAASAAPAAFIAERVYVETGVDSDNNGRRDRVAIDINRPASGRSPVVLEHTPYKEGLGTLHHHPVDVGRLPQEAGRTAFRDGRVPDRPTPISRGNLNGHMFDELLAAGYATISGQSIGTASSDGCPTSGDMQEALGGVAIIDWLNGRARGFDAGGREVRADWATGRVGMTGVSYNGTLPNMIAATGVEGLAAIVPVAGQSDWYEYYRANGLVVAPGGYQGEDTDVLARAVLRKSGGCAAQIAALGRAQGREHGDLTQFWKDRQYSDKAGNVKAAVLVVHGLADWNVKGTHYAKWYEALARADKPRRILLHRGGHGPGSSFPGYHQLITRWWDRYLKGVDNGVDREPRADVDVDGTWRKFADWPDPAAKETAYRLGAADATAPGTLTTGTPAGTAAQSFTDLGRNSRVGTLIGGGNAARDGRLIYLTEPMAGAKRISGVPRVTLTLAVENRTAANLTVALASYDSGGNATHLTRGWADPQNAASVEKGTPLTPGRPVTITFNLEPQDRRIAAGRRLGLVVTSTDVDYTLRPPAGTRLRVEPAGSSLTVRLASD
ncbi:putative Xaa-Pro dipeptidyl-peptidase [Pilimelia anulata]|uniref:Xaa-Pro dipeptidyl-peptidase n=1 Tax=Pilimelia anulata TaxID=53371 RepID=A0A8J3B363_9ACTN|nr:CocE/NonD family hydrolase [Pilimelia anulata]GGJ78415.1 putative Xaa-Pro dipeptidyl-peptidase [Pilimelia anulata]